VTSPTRFRGISGNRSLPWLAVAAIVVTGVLGLTFFAETLALGGDALNGRVVDGHYYVSNKGAYTEVTADQWNLSRIHGIAMFVSFPFGMVGMAFLLFRYVFPYVITGQAARPASPQVAAIRAAGWPVWAGSPGGVVGGVNFTIAMLGVAVYPTGLLLSPRFMTPFVVRADEIRGVRFGRRLMTSTIEIDHASTEVASPILIYGGRDSAQAEAISRLADGTLEPPTEEPSAWATGGSQPPQPVVPTAPGAAPSAWAASASPSWWATPPGPMRVLSVFGLIVAAVLVIAGLVYVIPTFGPIGVVWTAILVFILVWNARRFIRQGW
jgi:hypothetical protein